MYAFCSVYYSLPRIFAILQFGPEGNGSDIIFVQFRRDCSVRYTLYEALHAQGHAHLEGDERDKTDKYKKKYTQIVHNSKEVFTAELEGPDGNQGASQNWFQKVLNTNTQKVK